MAQSMILPGTYVEVRAEGLISAGGVTTGNIGIVGTACKGEVDKVYQISSLAEAKQIFGDKDDAGHLTLVRSLELIYQNGGTTVYAVRTHNHVKDKGAKAAQCAINVSDTSISLQAKSPGTWGNQLKLTSTPIEAPSTESKPSIDIADTIQGGETPENRLALSPFFIWLEVPKSFARL